MDTKNSLLEKRWTLQVSMAACLLFCICVLSRNYFMWYNFCQTNYDLGIFIEMIQKNAQGIINPYINVRQIGQFNDHWTAALSLVSPFERLVPMPHFAFWIEVVSLIGVLFVLWYMRAKDRISDWQFVFLSCFFFLNRDLFEAAYFPIHPATWGAAGLILWGFFIYNIDWKSQQLSRADKYLMLLNYFVLTLMDEQHTYIGVTFALALIILTHFKKYGVEFLLFSIAMVLWTSIGRRMVFGPLMPYFRERVATDWQHFANRYSDFSIQSVKTLILHLLIIVPVLFLMRGHWKTVKLQRQKLLLVLGLFGPLLLGRVLTNSFGRHYDIALIAFWAALFLVLIPRSAYTKKLTAWACVFFLVLSVSKIKKAILTPLELDGLNCVRRGVSQTDFNIRREKLNAALEMIADRTPQPDFKIIAMSNLGPNLLVRFPKAEVYHLGEYFITNTTSVDWIMFERGQFGEYLSISQKAPDDIIKLILDLPTIDFVHEDDELFMAHGKIPVDVLKEYYVKQPTEQIAGQQ